MEDVLPARVGDFFGHAARSLPVSLPFSQPMLAIEVEGLDGFVIGALAQLLVESGAYFALILRGIAVVAIHANDKAVTEIH